MKGTSTFVISEGNVLYIQANHDICKMDFYNIMIYIQKVIVYGCVDSLYLQQVGKHKYLVKPITVRNKKTQITGTAD